MAENNNVSRNELVDMEETNSNLKAQYKLQTKEAFERKINKPLRVVFALSGLFGLLIMIALSRWIFLKGNSELISFIHIFAVGATICTGVWTVFLSWAAISGKLKIKTFTKTLISGGFILSAFFLVVLFLVIYVIPLTLEINTNSNTLVGIQLSMIGFFAILTGGIVTILTIIYRFQYQTKRKLLEIAYRLAEISEKIEKKQ